MNRKYLICLFALLVFLATAFIFNNSLKDGVESNQSSDKIVKIVEPIVEELCEDPDIDVSFFVRKSAHLFEFMLLGLAASSLTALLGRFTGVCLFYGLFIGVIDEFIQSFTGRTSAVRDVLIDFSGFLLGAVLVVLIAALARRYTARKRAVRSSLPSRNT